MSEQLLSLQQEQFDRGVWYAHEANAVYDELLPMWADLREVEEQDFSRFPLFFTKAVVRAIEEKRFAISGKRSFFAYKLNVAEVWFRRAGYKPDSFVTSVEQLDDTTEVAVEPEGRLGWLMDESGMPTWRQDIPNF